MAIVLGPGLVVIASMVMAAGCECGRSLRPPSQPPAGTASDSPASSRPTSDPEMVVANLDRHIEANLRRLDEGRATPFQLRNLVGDLRTRAQFLGVISDYDRALEVAETLVSRDPGIESLVVLAGARASLHDWDGVRAALAAARNRGMRENRDADLQGALAAAEGAVGRAIAIRSAVAEKQPSLVNLASLANAQAASGDIEAAERNFREARRRYRKPSPLPLAWSLFQHGLMLERAGRPARAAILYDLALERFPRYASAASHRAAIAARRGQAELAESLLRRIVERADDPAYTGQLGALLLEHGRQREGHQLIERARRDYQRLLASHPAAFADHAVDFYLGPGRDPARALELAELAVRSRPIAASYQLLLRASAAAESPARRCDRAEQATTAPDAGAVLHLLRAQALRACGREKAAARALAAAESAEREW